MTALAISPPATDKAPPRALAWAPGCTVSKLDNVITRPDGLEVGVALSMRDADTPLAFYAAPAAGLVKLVYGKRGEFSDGWCRLGARTPREAVAEAQRRWPCVER